MINLLPPNIKETMAYARRNLTLVKWVTAISVGIIGIVVVVLVGYFFINQTTDAYASEVQRAKDRLAAQKLEETQKRVDDISTSTKLALQVLSRQVVFSELLKQIGAAMPPGAALQNLSIAKLEGGIDLQVVAVDQQTATQVQVNLQDPSNKVFEKADILNITCTTPNENDENETADQYPCQVSIRALFAKNSPYLFTNQTEDTP